MTVSEWCRAQLKKNGMSQDQAEACLSLFVKSDLAEPMLGRFEQELDQFVNVELAALVGNLKLFALEWIDENCPRAWFRPMFVE